MAASAATSATRPKRSEERLVESHDAVAPCRIRPAKPHEQPRLPVTDPESMLITADPAEVLPTSKPIELGVVTEVNCRAFRIRSPVAGPLIVRPGCPRFEQSCSGYRDLTVRPVAGGVVYEMPVG